MAPQTLEEPTALSSLWHQFAASPENVQYTIARQLMQKAGLGGVWKDMEFWERDAIIKSLKTGKPDRELEDLLMRRNGEPVSFTDLCEPMAEVLADKQLRANLKSRLGEDYVEQPRATRSR